MNVELRTILEFRLLGTRIATLLLAYRVTPPPGFPRSHPGGIGHFRKWFSQSVSTVGGLLLGSSGAIKYVRTVLLVDTETGVRDQTVSYARRSKRHDSREAEVPNNSGRQHDAISARNRKDYKDYILKPYTCCLHLRVLL